MAQSGSDLQHVHFLITLRPGVNEQDFEKFMFEEFLPSNRLLLRVVSGVTHTLFKSAGGQYLWRLEIHFVSPRTLEPAVLDEVYQAEREKLQPYGTLAPPFAEVGTV